MEVDTDKMMQISDNEVNARVDEGLFEFEPSSESGGGDAEAVAMEMEPQPQRTYEEERLEKIRQNQLRLAAIGLAPDQFALQVYFVHNRVRRNDKHGPGSSQNQHQNLRSRIV